MASVIVTDVFWPPASTTVTVSVLLPATTGVPLIVPAEFIERPAGSVPAVIDHTNGPVPPDAASGRWYGAPTSPSGRLALRPWATVIVIAVDADCPLRSVTVT